MDVILVCFANCHKPIGPPWRAVINRSQKSSKHSL